MFFNSSFSPLLTMKMSIMHWNASGVTIRNEMKVLISTLNTTTVKVLEKTYPFTTTHSFMYVSTV